MTAQRRKVWSPGFSRQNAPALPHAALRSDARKPNPAFTLIEVLLAITAGAIVLAAINGIYYGALHLQVKTTSAIEEILPANHAINVMKQDIANMVLPTGALGGSLSGGTAAATTQTTGVGINGPVSLQLFTSTGTLSDEAQWGDIQKVYYSLENPTNSTRNAGKDLVRSITRNLLSTIVETPIQQRLLEDVQALQVSFYDGNNWVETFDSTTATNLPTAIRIHIDLAKQESDSEANPPIEFLVPIMVSWPAEVVQ